MRACEIHYFRVSPDLWPLYLLRARQLGVDTVSTYIPWMWHEPTEGRFDFTGETDSRRDLTGFCALVERFGMGLIAKPGPFVDAELLGGGVPSWLHREQPELIAERADGSAFLHGVAAIVRPGFLPRRHRRGGRARAPAAPARPDGGDRAAGCPAMTASRGSASVEDSRRWFGA